MADRIGIELDSPTIEDEINELLDLGKKVYVNIPELSRMTLTLAKDIKGGLWLGHDDVYLVTLGFGDGEQVVVSKRLVAAKPTTIQEYIEKARILAKAQYDRKSGQYFLSDDYVRVANGKIKYWLKVS